MHCHDFLSIRPHDKQRIPCPRPELLIVLEQQTGLPTILAVAESSFIFSRCMDPSGETNRVTEDVFKSFEKAIDAKNINPEYQFYSLNIEGVEKVFVEGNHIKICIKFVSEQFKNNDENTVVKKQDSWTFEKTISSRDPNWLLSST